MACAGDEAEVEEDGEINGQGYEDADGDENDEVRRT